MRKLITKFKQNFREGDIRKYLRMILFMIFYMAFFTLWDFIHNPETVETDGTILGWILAYLFMVFLLSFVMIISYTLISPSFCGWLINKVKRKRKR